MSKPTTNSPPTSTGGNAKIVRAHNQIKNAQRLIAGLPKRYYAKGENKIDNIITTLKNIAEEIEKLKIYNSPPTSSNKGGGIERK